MLTFIALFITICTPSLYARDAPLLPLLPVLCAQFRHNPVLASIMGTVGHAQWYMVHPINPWYGAALLCASCDVALMTRSAAPRGLHATCFSTGRRRLACVGVCVRCVLVDPPVCAVRGTARTGHSMMSDLLTVWEACCDVPGYQERLCLPLLAAATRLPGGGGGGGFQRWFIFTAIVSFINGWQAPFQMAFKGYEEGWV